MDYEIAVLMTCHNRRDKTLTCLRNLGIAVGKAGNAATTVFLVDDGSDDGTADVVAKTFPDVRVMHGSGKLYWARGMRKAWEAALAERTDWDGYLWLNDDVQLDEDAVERTVIESGRCPGDVIVGALRDGMSGRRVYGVGDDGLFTGSFVFVPQAAFRKVGMLSDAYRHAWADYDYALMCRRADVAYSCMDSTVGVTESHPLRPCLNGLTFRERLRMLKNPKGWCVEDLWNYRVRNFGVLSAIASCAHMVAHVLTARE